jgi:hypothetical protein
MIFGTEFGCVFLYWHLIFKFIANSDIWTSQYLNDCMLFDFEFFSVPCLLAPHSVGFSNEFCIYGHC